MRISRQRLVQVTCLAAVLCACNVFAQPPAVDSSRRRIAIEKLGVVGSALYIGAHPDDENTAMLAWLAQGRKVRTAYLSLTRGDGGQNLIGTEQGDPLGVIRTEELLAARSIDGAEQYFTRAIDFGYSKGPEETLRFWGHDAVLSDVVWVIRSFRPDVIITRFPANGDGGHGHHTASAILAAEAFTAAADPRRYPEQLHFAQPWQAKRLMWNAWRREGEQRPANAKPQLAVDLGAYDPVLGASFAEIAAASRSMHKSQGFGSAPRRGPLPNYLEMVAGEPAVTDLFDGVDLTWKRLPGGAGVEELIDRAVSGYRDTDPGASVPVLLKALAAIDNIERGPLVAQKRGELVEAIRMCTGLWLEAMADAPVATPGSTVQVTAVAVNRSAVPLALIRVETGFPTATPPGSGEPAQAVPLADNTPATLKLSVQLPREIPYTQPYWLAAPHGLGFFNVTDQMLIGQPRTPPAVVATFVLRAEGRELRYAVPVQHRWTDPVEGERTRELAIVPPVTVDLGAPVLILSEARDRTVRVTARAHEGKISAFVRLVAPAGWRVEPERAAFEFASAGDESTARFTVTPPAGEGTGGLTAFVRTDREEPARCEVEISHTHIPPQTLLPPAAVKLVRVDIARPVARVAYVMGPGDEIPGILRQLGFEVVLLSDDDLEDADLSKFGAVVVGVRAYNTRPRLGHAQDRLLAYAQGGGTLVVQYDTERGLVTDRLGPFPLKLSRDRVTDETAPVTVLIPGHPLLTTPHAIAAADFNEWVQERGLYFAGSWDQQYQALLAMSDPGEKPLQGGLLFARYGNGSYVHTSLSFFRQLPAGVPGAIRLFVNLLAGGRPHA